MGEGASGFDWPGLLRLACRGLGLRPSEFWALTPFELLILLGREGGAAPLNRHRLMNLAAEFPDQEQQ